MSRNILLLPGDGIGPEIVSEAEKVLRKINDSFGLNLNFEAALVGGAAIDEHDTPLPEDTLAKAKAADAIILGGGHNGLVCAGYLARAGVCLNWNVSPLLVEPR